MLSVSHLEQRADRLFAQADALQDTLYALPSWNAPETQRQLRQMSRMYAEAATICLCLHAFEDAQARRARDTAAC